MNIFKETIIKFSELIHHASEVELSSTVSFISLHKNFLNQNPQYANQIYFRCIELFIRDKKTISLEDTKKVFPELSIEDPFNVNGGYVHYSTITNALAVCNLLKNHSYFQDRITIRDNPMPRFNGDNVISYIENNFPSQIKNALTETNQKTPDFSVQFNDQKRFYDLKMTKSTSYTSQRVAPLDYESFNFKFEKHYIKEILGHIDQLKKVPTNNTNLQKNLNDIELKIKSIVTDTNISIITKNQLIHEIMLKTEHYPSDLRVSIIYPINVNPFRSTVSDKIMNKMPSSVNNLDDNALIKGLKAGIGIYGNSTVKKTAQIPGITQKLQQSLDSDDT
jgi:hypothetical protein